MKHAQKRIRELGIEPIDQNVGCEGGSQYYRNGRDGSILNNSRSLALRPSPPDQMQCNCGIEGWSLLMTWGHDAQPLRP